MGYTTDFEGTITVEPPLNPAEITYLRKFAGTRRMDRENGPYFADGTGYHGQGSDADIRNYNSPPVGQPGLWCQWTPTDDGTGIEWDGGEKFYEAEEWMRYIVDHFLKDGAHAMGQPGFESFLFGHVLNGTVAVQGEDPADRWDLVVTGNVVSRVDYDLVPRGGQ